LLFYETKDKSSLWIFCALTKYFYTLSSDKKFCFEN